MAEGARLESVYMVTYRGFESLPLCNKNLNESLGFYLFFMLCGAYSCEQKSIPSQSYFINVPNPRRFGYVNVTIERICNPYP